jgi:hypothetical protein
MVGQRWQGADVILGGRVIVVRCVHSDEHVMDLFLSRIFKFDMDVDAAWPDECIVQIIWIIGA